jgi:hypothetical protein
MPTDLLRDLRAQLDSVDAEWDRTTKDKRDASEALRLRIEAWDAHLDFLRGQRARLVQRIKDESQSLRGVGQKAPYAAPKLTAIAPDDPRAVALRECNDHGN